MTWCLVTVLSILFIGWLGGIVAAGPMGAIVDDLVPQQQQVHQMRPQGQVNPQYQEQLRQPDMEAFVPDGTDPQTTAIATAWWTFFALLLGLAAAGLGGYLASPANLRESTGGIKGTARSANRSEHEI